MPTVLSGTGVASNSVEFLNLTEGTSTNQQEHQCLQHATLPVSFSYFVYHNRQQIRSCFSKTCNYKQLV